jgi:organic radical activating enzyme
MITQNIDRIVSRKDFADKTELAVTSIFNTIQGEGPLAGQPAVFIRLAGCNFGDKKDTCGFCDSAFHLDQARWLKPLELAEEAAAIKNKSRVVVITGGEPLLQTNLWELLAILPRYFDTIQIESNGTPAYFFAPALGRQDWLDIPVMLVVSPKANDRLKKYTPTPPAVLAHTSALKFLLSADPESVYHTVPDWAAADKRLRNAARDLIPVYVSPIAVYKKAYQGEVSSIWDRELIDAEATQRNYVYAAQYCIDNGYILSLQTHLFTAIP